MDEVFCNSNNKKLTIWKNLRVISDRFWASATHDAWEFCNYQVIPNWGTALNVYEIFQRQVKLTAVITFGISIVDPNNDGFLDIYLMFTTYTNLIILNKTHVLIILKGRISPVLHNRVSKAVLSL
jgi:hypothetical protein